MGEAHCNIDIEKKPEFREFHDFGPNETPDHNTAFGLRGRDFLFMQDGTWRLSSGKTIAHGKAKKSQLRLEDGRFTESRKDADALMIGSGKTTNALGKKPRDLARKFLAAMRREDHLALAHLPLATPRSLVLLAKKQQELGSRFQKSQAAKQQCKDTKRQNKLVIRARSEFKSSRNNRFKEMRRTGLGLEYL
ncbi:hypothetical protein Cob_v001812 [Colletotrichum orbiculare MAFF 240422]|uniref:Uncharacterized protein n=1 Tax=Colletotrichum orbiculare (strain 104-T / ATCC 96160 / CBS 514.97 / LARS 414 / MAFF 240422) TaxID=1213857 RepID=A0A484G7I4_COLOR|nr:hypothetical protein Cob_v001812 [Colletotrichum orbiculare MAFF 240422]